MVIAMKFLIRNAPLREIKRLSPSDYAFDSSLIRIRRTPTCDLIFYEDFENMSSNELAKVILEYNLDPDRVGVIIDEVKIIHNPYILRKTQKIINPSKIYIRPKNTVRTTKMIREAIEKLMKKGLLRT